MKAMKLSAVLFVTGALFLSSCVKEVIRGRGSIVTQERPVSGFTKVKITGSTDITIVQGSSFKVAVSDYENLVDDIETSVIGDELRVGYRKHTLVTRGNSKATITMPSLKGLRVDGSGNFAVNGPFTLTGLFSIEINGSGNVSIADATAEDADIHVSGSGDINAFGLQCNIAKVKIDGSGNTELTVNKQLDVRINGSGDVYYKGNASVNASINGSGKVIKR
jgi:hypothetical protein